MTVIKTLAAAAAATVLATNAFAQSAREIRGASPYLAIENEPATQICGASKIVPKRALNAPLRWLAGHL